MVCLVVQYNQLNLYVTQQTMHQQLHKDLNVTALLVSSVLDSNRSKFWLLNIITTESGTVALGSSGTAPSTKPGSISNSL